MRLRLLFLALGAFGMPAVTAAPLEIGGGKIDVAFDEPAPLFRKSSRSAGSKPRRGR